MSGEGLKRWNVTITRWDVYRVSRVEAGTPAAAEERALEIYEECEYAEHVDGGVNTVLAELADE